MSELPPNQPSLSGPDVNQTSDQAHFDECLALLQGTVKGDDYVRFNERVNDIKAALRWGLEQGNYQETSILLAEYVDIQTYLGNRDAQAEFRPLVEGALDRIEDISVRCELVRIVARLYRTAIDGDTETNLEHSMKLIDSIIGLETLEENRLGYVKTQCQLAYGYMLRYQSKQQLSDLGSVLEILEAAAQYLTADSDRRDYAEIKYHIAHVHAMYLGTENARLHLHQAVKSYQEALQLLDPDLDRRLYVETSVGYATVHWRLANYEGKVKNLLRSIHINKDLMPLLEEDNINKSLSVAYHNLGLAYMTLSEVADHHSNLQQARECFDKSADYFDAQTTPHASAALQLNRSIIHHNLAHFSDAFENLMQSIEIAEGALKIADPVATPNLVGKLYYQLGRSYLSLAGHTLDRERNLETAITMHKKALTYFPEDVAGIDVTRTMTELGAVYATLMSVTNRPEVKAEAFKYYRESLEYAKANGYVSQIAAANFSLGALYSSTFYNVLWWPPALFYMLKGTFYVFRAGQMSDVMHCLRILFSFIFARAMLLFIAWYMLSTVLG